MALVPQLSAEAEATDSSAIYSAGLLRESAGIANCTRQQMEKPFWYQDNEPEHAQLGEIRSQCPNSTSPGNCMLPSQSIGRCSRIVTYLTGPAATKYVSN